MYEAIVRGNAGAFIVCIELTSTFGQLTASADFLIMEREGIIGAEVWILYMNCCGADLNALHEAIQAGQAVEMLRKIKGSRFYTGMQDALEEHE